MKVRSRAALRALLSGGGVGGERAGQLAAWRYRRGVDDFGAMTDLSNALREQLAAEFDAGALEIVRVRRSADGTRKLLLRAWDGAHIESVLIPEERRVTLCISSQVGCPLACSFCATGGLGFARNLSCAEIVDQVLRAREQLGADEGLSNLVFMGMGEPLLNWPAVAEAIRLFTDPKAFGLAPRRITVSTAGVLPRIRSLLELAPINLAVSLHATRDSVRDRLVPLNRRFGLDALLGSLRSEPLISPRRPVFFEYTLIEGVNDAEQDARSLPRLLRGIPARLNLIPMNAHAGSELRPPSREACDRFARVVHEAGLRVTLRRSRGEDIEAACGQLAAQNRSELG